MMFNYKAFKLPAGARLRCQTVERGQVEFALDVNGRVIKPTRERVTVLSAEVVVFDDLPIKLDLPPECDADSIECKIVYGSS